MIIGSIANFAECAAAVPVLARFVRHLGRASLDGVEDGTYALGDGIRAIVQGYATKEPGAARLEAHRRFADLQFIASGVERMGYAPIGRAGSPVAPYDAGKDIVFLDGAFEALTFRAGDFAVFLPQDAHAPGIMAGPAPSGVRKVVVKIPVELLG